MEPTFWGLKEGEENPQRTVESSAKKPKQDDGTRNKRQRGEAARIPPPTARGSRDEKDAGLDEYSRVVRGPSWQEGQDTRTQWVCVRQGNKGSIYRGVGGV